MAVPPRRMRQLPAALPPKDSDVFPISQMDDNGVPTTRAMTRAQNNAEMIAVINAARQEFVDTANAEHEELRNWIDDLQNRVISNEVADSNIQTAITMVQQMIASGDGGKSAYQLWLELPGNSGKTIQQFFDAMAGAPGTTKWDGITDKPATFTPSQHTHPISDVIGAQTALDGKADSVHTHNQGEIVGLNDALDKKADLPISWGSVAGKPNTFSPSSHGHPISDVTGLQSALDAKLPGAIILGEVDVVDSAVVALSLGVRSKDVTVPASWGLRATDTLFVTPSTTLPLGYAIDNAVPLSTTSIRVYFMAPALALLASNTLKVRVAAIGRSS